MSLELFEAAERGEVGYLKTWLEDPNNDLGARDQHGLSVLHHACLHKKEKLVQFCLKHPRAALLLEAYTDSGDTPLITAVQTSDVKIVEMLIERGVAVNVWNDFGNTPMHYALFYCSSEIAMLLLKNKARTNFENKFGHLCTQRGDSELNDIITAQANEQGLGGNPIPYSGPQNKLQRDRERMFRHIFKKGVSVAVAPQTITELSDDVLWEYGTTRIRSCMFKGTDMHLRQYEMAKIKDEHFRELIIDDIQELRLLSVPHVAPVCGALVKIPDSLSLLTESFGKGTLRDFLSKSPAHEIANMDMNRGLLHLIKAMGYITHLKIPVNSHYLLSTSNIKVDSEYNLFVDLSSVIIKRIQTPPMLMTDVAFIAPEVLEKGLGGLERIEAPSHVYSTGMVCVEMLTCKEPFHYTENASKLQFLLAQQIIGGAVTPTIPSEHDNSPLKKIATLCTKLVPDQRPLFSKLAPIAAKLAAGSGAKRTPGSSPLM